MEKTLKAKGLCWRCEHRILNIESDGKYQPRCECGDRNHSSCSCYMYRPVRPVALSRNEGDKRPRFVGYMISSRERAAENQPELKLHLYEHKDFTILCWQPDETKKVKSDKRKKKQDVEICFLEIL